MIIFLYGADTFRSHRWLQDLKKKFIKDVDQNSYSLAVLDGITITLKDLSEKINTGSLFVKKRLVVIENIFKNKHGQIFPELHNYLKKIASQDDSLLIFWETALDEGARGQTSEAKKLLAFLKKQPYAQEFKSLTNSQLLSFIKKEAASHNKEINAPAANLLISLTGGDLWLIVSELKKLAFHTTQPLITLEDIQEMTNGIYDEDIFSLTDALSTKNKALTLKLLEEQLAAGLSDEYLLAMMIRQFKILLRLKSAQNNSIKPTDLATQLKLHPFVVKKGLSQAQNFSEENLKNSLNFLINLDFLNKTGRTDVKTELIMLISRL